MQIQAKIGGILYDCGGKPDSNYLDLVRLHSSNYKSLVASMQNADRWLVILQYSGTVIFTYSGSLVHLKICLL